MKSSQICTSIEGQSIDIQCRKFTAHPPRRDPNLGLVYPFKLGIRGLARVGRPLDPGSDPWRSGSFTASGDQIFGETIDGFAGKPIRNVRVGPATGRHKGSFVTIRGPAYAHVEIGVRELLQRKSKSNQE